MNVSNALSGAWQNTAHRRSWWIAAGTGVLVLLAVLIFGVCSMVGWVITTVSPPAPQPDQLTLKQVDRHEQDAALVALFAKWCVKLAEEATPDTVDNLNQCFTVPPEHLNHQIQVSSAQAVGATASDLDAWAPKLVGQDSHASMWSVLVAVTVKEFGSAAAIRKYVWLSVVLPADPASGPRATLEPDDRATALPAGPDVELAYDRDVSPSSPLGSVVTSFLTAYLVGPPDDVAKFVTADSGLTGLGALYDAPLSIEAMKADAVADGPPAPDQQVHVLVTLTAAHKTGGKKPMQYPLLLVDAGGRWAVAALEDMPATTGRLLPAGGR